MNETQHDYLRRAETGGGDPAAEHGADAARGEPEDDAGQHVQQAGHQVQVPLTLQDQG